MVTRLLKPPSKREAPALAQAAPLDVPAFTPLMFEARWASSVFTEVREIRPGTQLVGQGQLVKEVFLIHDGLVRLSHDSEHGRESTVGLRASGWFAGASPALLGARSVYSIEAVTACSVAGVDAGTFINEVRNNPELLMQFISSLCQEIMSQASMQVAIMGSSGAERLDRLMNERRLSTQIRAVDPLPLLKQIEVAQLLSITPEYLSRLRNKRRLRVESAFPKAS